jgi:Smg protein
LLPSVHGSRDDQSSPPPGAFGYSVQMFDVLVYLYENYWRPDACPDSGQLVRKLTAVGFEQDEIKDALTWLDGLHGLSGGAQPQPSAASSRVYTAAELERLGPDALGFLQFMESAGVLSATLREVVLDRVDALPEGSVSLEDFKVVLLMVFWGVGQEPDALVLDELFVSDEEKVIH